MKRLLLALPLLLGSWFARPSNPAPGVLTATSRTADSLIMVGTSADCGSVSGDHTGVLCRIQWLAGATVIRNATKASTAPTADTLRWHSLAAGTKVRLRLRSCLGTQCSHTVTTQFIVPTSGTGTPVVASLLSLTISPKATLVDTVATRQFSASAYWSDGTTTLPTLAWSATGGTITSGGLYTSHDTAGTSYRVIVSGGGKADTAAVTINALTASVSVAVSNTTVTPGQSDTVTFSGGLQGDYVAVYVSTASVDTYVDWRYLNGTQTAPDTTSAGSFLFPMPTTAGTYEVRFIRDDVNGCNCRTVLAKSAIITVGNALLTLTIAPKPVSVDTTHTQQFTASATWSNGTTTLPALTWTATGGSITTGGLYTAHDTVGSYRAIVSGGGKADTSFISVRAASTTGIAAAPALPALLTTTYVAPGGRTLTPADTLHLQATIDTAACGDEIRLAAGARYTGNFTLPARSCASNPIHIRTTGTLPTEGVRVSPTTAAGFAKILSPNTASAITAAAGASGYRIVAVEIGITPGVSFIYSLVYLGRSTYSETLSSHITLDRVYIHGSSTAGMQRCVALNGQANAVIDSYLSDCHASGFDSQAVGVWDGNGPYKIVNNYLEAAGENILFGGATFGPEGVPADIEIRRNYLFKPLAWQVSGAWTVKNLLELKNAQRVLIEGNVLKNSWSAAQGTGILFQVISDQNQAGTTIQDVTMRYNRYTSSAQGMDLLGDANTSVTPMARIAITDNIFESVAQPGFGGIGLLLQIRGGWNPAIGLNDLNFSHNTLLHYQPTGTITIASINMENHGAPMQRLVILNNILTVPSGNTLWGQDAGAGTAGLNAKAASWDFRGNVGAGETNPAAYPTGNYFPLNYAALGFDSNLRLGSSSGLLGRGTDGKDPGADITALLAAISGVVP